MYIPGFNAQQLCFLTYVPLYIYTSRLKWLSSAIQIGSLLSKDYYQVPFSEIAADDDILIVSRGWYQGGPTHSIAGDAE